MPGPRSSLLSLTFVALACTQQVPAHLDDYIEPRGELVFEISPVVYEGELREREQLWIDGDEVIYLRVTLDDELVRVSALAQLTTEGVAELGDAAAAVNLQLDSDCTQVCLETLYWSGQAYPVGPFTSPPAFAALLDAYREIRQRLSFCEALVVGPELGYPWIDEVECLSANG